MPTMNSEERAGSEPPQPPKASPNVALQTAPSAKRQPSKEVKAQHERNAQRQVQQQRQAPSKDGKAQQELQPSKDGKIQQQRRPSKDSNGKQERQSSRDGDIQERTQSRNTPTTPPSGDGDVHPNQKVVEKQSGSTSSPRDNTANGEAHKLAVNPNKKARGENSNLAVNPDKDASREASDKAVNPNKKASAENSNLAVNPDKHASREAPESAVTTNKKPSGENSNLAVNPDKHASREASESAANTNKKPSGENSNLAVNPEKHAGREASDSAVNTHKKASGENSNLAVNPEKHASTEASDSAVNTHKKASGENSNLVVNPEKHASTEASDLAVNPNKKKANEFQEISKDQKGVSNQFKEAHSELERVTSPNSSVGMSESRPSATLSGSPDRGQMPSAGNQTVSGEPGEAVSPPASDANSFFWNLFGRVLAGLDFSQPQEGTQETSAPLPVSRQGLQDADSSQLPPGSVSDSGPSPETLTPASLQPNVRATPTSIAALVRADIHKTTQHKNPKTEPTPSESPTEQKSSATPIEQNSGASATEQKSCTNPSCTHATCTNPACCGKAVPREAWMLFGKMLVDLDYPNKEVRSRPPAPSAPCGSFIALHGEVRRRKPEEGGEPQKKSEATALFDMVREPRDLSRETWMLFGKALVDLDYSLVSYNSTESRNRAGDEEPDLLQDAWNTFKKILEGFNYTLPNERTNQAPVLPPEACNQFGKMLIDLDNSLPPPQSGKNIVPSSDISNMFEKMLTGLGCGLPRDTTDDSGALSQVTADNVFGGKLVVDLDYFVPPVPPGGVVEMHGSLRKDGKKPSGDWNKMNAKPSSVLRPDGDATFDEMPASRELSRENWRLFGKVLVDLDHSVPTEKPTLLQEAWNSFRRILEGFNYTLPSEVVDQPQIPAQDTGPESGKPATLDDTNKGPESVKPANLDGAIGQPEPRIESAGSGSTGKGSGKGKQETLPKEAWKLFGKMLVDLDYHLPPEENQRSVRSSDICTLFGKMLAGLSCAAPQKNQERIDDTEDKILVDLDHRDTEKAGGENVSKALDPPEDVETVAAKVASSPEAAQVASGTEAAAEAAAAANKTSRVDDGADERASTATGPTPDSPDRSNQGELPASGSGSSAEDNSPRSAPKPANIEDMSLTEIAEELAIDDSQFKSNCAMLSKQKLGTVKDVVKYLNSNAVILSAAQAKQLFEILLPGISSRAGSQYTPRSQLLFALHSFCVQPYVIWEDDGEKQCLWQNVTYDDVGLWNTGLCEDLTGMQDGERKAWGRMLFDGSCMAGCGFWASGNGYCSVCTARWQQYGDIPLYPDNRVPQSFAEAKSLLRDDVSCIREALRAYRSENNRQVALQKLVKPKVHGDIGARL